MFLSMSIIHCITSISVVCNFSPKDVVEVRPILLHCTNKMYSLGRTNVNVIITIKPMAHIKMCEYTVDIENNLDSALWPLMTLR